MSELLRIRSHGGRCRNNVVFSTPTYGGCHDLGKGHGFAHQPVSNHQRHRVPQGAAWNAASRSLSQSDTRSDRSTGVTVVRQADLAFAIGTTLRDENGKPLRLTSGRYRTEKGNRQLPDSTSGAYTPFRQSLSIIGSDGYRY